ALTFRRGTIFNARFAPDGQSVIYGAAWEGKPFELFMTRPENPESRSLGITEAEPLAISSTGEIAVLLRRRPINGWQTFGTLARMPLAGGAPRELAEKVADADWSPDGQHLLIVRYEGTRCVLDYPQGNRLVETTGWISNPRIS